MKDCPALSSSRALWNRSYLDLRSEEVIAQILDRGELEAWRELFRLAREDIELRRRIHRVIERVPLDYGHFWLSAVASLGEQVDMGKELPTDDL